MTASSKKRIVKDYDALSEDILNQVKLNYPNGFAEHLIKYTNKEGKYVSALPFETDDIYYLIRMTATEAEQIIEDDEDYDDDGNLKEEFADSIGSDDVDEGEED